MIPAHARLLVCPHCGGTKEILSLISGNTFGAKQWSDNKMIAPMLPKVSMVQQCPECGHFYLLSQVKDEREGNSYSSEKGELTWDEMKKAIKESDSWKMNSQDILNLCFTALWCFNDQFYRDGEEDVEPTAEDMEIHFNNLDKLIPLVEDPIMHAEMLRERHLFKEALEELNNTPKPSKDFLASIYKGIKERAQAEDPRPFLVSNGSR